MLNLGSAALAAIVLAIASTSVPAQQKPIRILVGLTAGGTLDNVTRLFADRLRVSLGQPVVVENRPGASGLIAIEALKAAPADGLVLLSSASGLITLLPHTFKTPRFDPTRDFLPVAQMAQGDFILSVNATTPARTAAEFAALAKSEPKFRSFGTPHGTNPHLLATMFANAAGFAPVQVPYKGNSQALTDLLGGQIAAAFLSAGEGLGLHRSGKIRILASTGSQRSSLMPDIHTLKESGYDVEGSAWFALFAPTGTPEGVVERLGRATVEVAASPEVRDRLTQFGVEAAGLAPKMFAEKIRVEYEHIGKQLRASGFKQQN